MYAGNTSQHLVFNRLFHPHLHHLSPLSTNKPLLPLLDSPYNLDTSLDPLDLQELAMNLTTYLGGNNFNTSVVGGTLDTPYTLHHLPLVTLLKKLMQTSSPLQDAPNRPPYDKVPPNHNYIPYMENNDQTVELLSSTGRKGSWRKDGGVPPSEVPLFIFDRPVVRFTLIALFSTVFVTGLIGE